MRGVGKVRLMGMGLGQKEGGEERVLLGAGVAYEGSGGYGGRRREGEGGRKYEMGGAASENGRVL